MPLGWTALIVSGALDAPVGTEPFVWSADADACPTQAEVEQTVIDLAGRLPRPDEVQIEATARRADGVWELDLVAKVDDTVQRRSLAADTCEALANAAALYVAVAVDPTLAGGLAIDPEPRDAPDAPPIPVEGVSPLAGRGFSEPVPAEPRPTLVPDPPREPPPVFGVAGVSAGAAMWTITEVTGVVGLSLGVDIGLFRVAARGRYFSPRDSSRSVGARLQGGTVGLLGCRVQPVPALDALSVPLCAGLEAGAMQGRGINVVGARTERWPWVAAVLSAGIRWGFRPPLALRFDLETGIHLIEHDVVVGTSVVYASPRAGLRSLVGLEARFGATSR